MRGGFSATEVLVTTAILALALLPVVGMFSGGTQQQAFNEYFLVATNLARDVGDRVVERLLVTGFEVASSMPEGDPVDLAGTPYAVSTDDLGASYEASIFDVTAVGLTRLNRALYRLSIEVSWKHGAAGKTRSSVHHRLVARPDASMLHAYEPRQKGRP